MRGPEAGTRMLVGDFDGELVTGLTRLLSCLVDRPSRQKAPSRTADGEEWVGAGVHTRSAGPPAPVLSLRSRVGPKDTAALGRRDEPANRQHRWL